MLATQVPFRQQPEQPRHCVLALQTPAAVLHVWLRVKQLTQEYPLLPQATSLGTRHFPPSQQPWQFSHDCA